MGDNETTSTQTSGPTSPVVKATIDKFAKGLADEYTPGKSLYTAPSAETTGGIQGLLAASNNPTYNQGIAGALDMTADVAAGNRFGEQAPGYATLRANTIDDATVAANSPFANDMWGSDKHREAVGRGVAGAIAGMDYGNYQNDIARQERAMANLPGLLNASAVPAQMQLSAGGLLDADAAAKAAGPTDYLGKLIAASAGNAAAGGQTMTMTEPGTPWWQSALGFGIGGAGLLL